MQAMIITIAAIIKIMEEIMQEMEGAVKEDDDVMENVEDAVVEGV